MPTNNTADAAHRAFLKRCNELAALAAQGGDASVGSLVVLNGEVVGEGIESVKATNDVTAHAEIAAIRQATASLGTRELNRAVLYTSVAPCVMCAYAIRLARISIVVSGAPEPNTQGRIHGITVLCTENAVPNRAVPEYIEINDQESLGAE